MAMVDGFRLLTGLYSRWVAICFCDDYAAVYAFDCKADNDEVPHTKEPAAPGICEDLFLIEFNLVLALLVWLTAYAKGWKELNVT